MNPSVEFAGHNDIIRVYGKRIADAILDEVRRLVKLPDSLVSLTADFYKAPHTQRNVLQVTIKITTPSGVMSYELDPIPAPETKSARETAAIIIKRLEELCIEPKKVGALTTDSGMHYW